MSDIIMNKEELISEEMIDDMSPTRTNTYVENRDTVFSDMSSSTLVSIPKIVTTNVDGKELNNDDDYKNFTEEQYNGKRKRSIYKPVQKPPLQVTPTSVFHIFRFATPFDYFLMTLGVFFSILSGLLIPLMTKLLGNIFNVFTDKQTGVITNQVFDEKIKSLLIQFSLLGIGSLVLIGSMLTCWMWTGERQSKKNETNLFQIFIKDGNLIF